MINGMFLGIVHIHVCVYVYIYVQGVVRVRMGRAEIMPGGQLKLIDPNPDCVKDDCSNHDGNEN